MNRSNLRPFDTIFRTFRSQIDDLTGALLRQASRWSRSATLPCLLVSLCVHLATAQDITGEIDGTVNNSAGAVVPGAAIAVTNLKTKVLVRTVKSKGQAEYTVPLLAVGGYGLSITAPGFKAGKIDLITLDVGETETSNVEIMPGSIDSSVTVAASAIAPNIQTPENRAGINSLQMREQNRNTRNFEQMLTLQPGVSYAGPDQLYFGPVNVMVPAIPILLPSMVCNARRSRSTLMAPIRSTA